MTDVYGIGNQYGMDRFITSNRHMEVVVAAGSFGFSGGTQKRNSNDYGAWLTVHNVTIPKFFPINMLETRATTRRLPVRNVYQGTTRGSTIMIDTDNSNPVSEDNNNVYIGRVQLDSGDAGAFERSSINGTGYIVFTASLSDVVQALPDYGLILRNTNGQITFNSNYMPVILRGHGAIPTYYRSYVSNWNQGNIALPPGVDFNRVPLMPMIFTGLGAQNIGPGRMEGQLGLTALSNGTYNRRVAGDSGRGNSFFFGWDSYAGAGGFRVTFIHALDYF